MNPTHANVDSPFLFYLVTHRARTCGLWELFIERDTCEKKKRKSRRKGGPGRIMISDVIVYVFISRPSQTVAPYSGIIDAAGFARVTWRVCVPTPGDSNGSLLSLLFTSIFIIYACSLL